MQEECYKKLQEVLAQTIKLNRKQRSISRLSREIDLSKSIWSNVEKGTKDIQLSTFWRISEALEIQPEDLLKQIHEKLGSDFSFLENIY